jgi:adsorption protein B
VNFLEWFLAVAYLLGGLNDFFLDLVFYIGPLRRALAQGRENPRCEEYELHGIPEKWIAVMIPAWDESAVIGSMLESTTDRLDYRNYDIFVGTYPNDEATQFEVARAGFDRPNIHRVVCPNPGPTSKADCLNWIVEAIKLKESETGRRYEILVLEDAEDVVHPLVLKVHNRFIPEYDLVQIPVIPYERPLHKFTGNTYLDEFAEVHLKGLTSRLAIGGMVPSAGVGTGFSRDAVDELAAQTNHVPFPPVSLTEDYDFSFRLFRNDRKSGIAEVWVDRADAQDRHVKELVAIREFFPATFGDAVRQKQRWLLGITFQGAQKLGWGYGFREHYMLLRDRIGVITGFCDVVLLFLLGWVGVDIFEALQNHLPWSAGLGELRPSGYLDLIVTINFALLINRMLQRSISVARVARKRQALVAPIRMLWSHVIDFMCVYHATRRFIHSEITGTPLKWLKTAHEYPNVETLLRRHRPIGDILLEQRLISPDHLRNALATQQLPAFRDRYLGEILSEMGLITQDQLLEALGAQSNAKSSLRVPVKEIVLDNTSSIPIHINQVVKPLNSNSGQFAAAPSGISYPSQLRPAPPAPGPNLPVGLSSDPVARQVRSVHQARSQFRSFNFQGAAPRPRPVEPQPARKLPDSPDVLRPAVQQPGPIEFITEASHIVSQPSAQEQLNLRRFKMLHTVVDAPETLRKSPAKRFLVVIGTRPEAIKLAPVIAELRARAAAENRPDDVFVCTTGQHLHIVMEPLALFGIKPDLDLGIMQHGASLATISARVLESFSSVIAQVRPEWVIVQGDTATTAMAALAAFYGGVKVAHIEAGLRTHDLRNPFPEEANRRMVGIVADLHFAATEASRKNLLREGVPEESIRVTGNTGIDALRFNCERLGLRLGSGINDSPTRGPIRVLVTAHRRENLEHGIEDICLAIRNVLEAHPDRFHFVWPLHPNPRVSDIANRTLGGLRDVTLTPAVGYDRLITLMSQCDIVVTDSGGLQEEAPSFGKPVLILREATERPEGVWAGVARLVGTNPTHIQSALEANADAIEADRRKRFDLDILPAVSIANPYGDGYASARIADFFANQTVHEFAFQPAASSPRKPILPNRSDSGIRPAYHAIQ